MSGSVVVACCQLPLQVGDSAGNRATVLAAIRRAAGAGARVIVLPELSNTGYMFADLAELCALAETLDGPTIREWEAAAAELGVILVAGFAERGENGEVHNSAALIDETGLRASYRKAHLWNHEKVVGFTPGSGLPPVVETAVGKIGMMICYDLEFPEWVRAVSLAGAELLCAPVNWPLYPHPAGERPGEIVRVQANAGTNRMFVAAADRTGAERGQDWVGGSVIVDADGYPLTEISLGAEAMVLATLDLGEARNKVISENNDVFADMRPELYARIPGRATVSGAADRAEGDAE